MRTQLVGATLSILLTGSSLSACSTSPTRQQVGIGTGAVVGGVLGHAVTDGSVLGTAGGALVGGVVGNEVTKSKK